MKKALTIIVLAVCMGGFVALSQEQQSKRALAEELLVLMKVNETIEQSMAMVKQMIPAQMDQAAQVSGQTNIPPDVKNKTSQMMDMIAKEMSWENMKEDYITLYADTFTEEELRGLVAFYKSPIGQALAKKTPELTKKSMELSQKVMVKLMPKIQAMTQEYKCTPQPPTPKPEAKE